MDLYDVWYRISELIVENVDSTEISFLHVFRFSQVSKTIRSIVHDIVVSKILKGTKQLIKPLFFQPFFQPHSAQHHFTIFKNYVKTHHHFNCIFYLYKNFDSILAFQKEICFTLRLLSQQRIQPHQNVQHPAIFSNCIQRLFCGVLSISWQKIRISSSFVNSCTFLAEQLCPHFQSHMNETQSILEKLFPRMFPLKLVPGSATYNFISVCTLYTTSASIQRRIQLLGNIGCMLSAKSIIAFFALDEVDLISKLLVIKMLPMSFSSMGNNMYHLLFASIQDIQYVKDQLNQHSVISLSNFRQTKTVYKQMKTFLKYGPLQPMHKVFPLSPHVRINQKHKRIYEKWCGGLSLKHTISILENVSRFVISSSKQIIIAARFLTPQQIEERMPIIQGTTRIYGSTLWINSLLVPPSQFLPSLQFYHGDEILTIIDPAVATECHIDQLNIIFGYVKDRQMSPSQIQRIIQLVSLFHLSPQNTKTVLKQLFSTHMSSLFKFIQHFFKDATAK